MPRLILEQIHWGVAPCELCGEPAQGIYEEDSLLCFDCVERILDRLEAVHLAPQLRQSLPAFSDQFRLEPRPDRGA